MIEFLFAAMLIAPTESSGSGFARLGEARFSYEFLYNGIRQDQNELGEADYRPQLVRPKAPACTDNSRECRAARDSFNDRLKDYERSMDEWCASIRNTRIACQARF